MLFASLSCHLCSSDVLVPITITGSTWDDCLCFHVCLGFAVVRILFLVFKRGRLNLILAFIQKITGYMYIINLQVLMKDLPNVEACVLVGGCVLAVDLLTVVHEASERTSIPLQSNLLAATAFMEPLKEWTFIDNNGTHIGPLEKDAIRRCWSKKDIDWSTKCWASGMVEWKRLRDIRELRWALATRVPVLTSFQVGVISGMGLMGIFIVVAFVCT